MEKKIKQCLIKEDRFRNIISVIYDDETTEDKLGVYFPDEMHYTERDFIGLTRNQAINLMILKDIAYLRS